MTTTTTRSPRERILIVGDDRFAESWRSATSTPAAQSHDMFDAIGRVAAATSREPISTVVIDGALLADAGARGAEAITRVDPALDIIQIGGDPSTTPRGINRMFPASTSHRTIATELGLATSAAPPTEKPKRTTPPPPPPQRTPEPTPPPRPPSSVVKHPDRLGDTDLVAAMMDRDGDVPALALEMIRQQTGWADVTLRDAPPLKETIASAPVGEDQAQHLCSAAASTAELRPWAAWLAHWLSLNTAHQRYREMAYHDELTGAHNRRYYYEFVRDALARARQQRRPVTVMVFDLDDFKVYNDRFGHAAGDLILTETVRLLKSVIRSGDRVCRIGGDEFAVVFADPDGPREVGSAHPGTVEEIARRFQDQIHNMRFPKLGLEAPGCLSISGGLATFPWDGDDPTTLLNHADELALESKRKGKNVITFGPRPRD